MEWHISRNGSFADSLREEVKKEESRRIAMTPEQRRQEDLYRREVALSTHIDWDTYFKDEPKHCCCCTLY